MHIHRAGVTVKLKAPYFVQQLVAGKDAVGVGSKVVDQLQLFGRRVNLHAVDFQFIVGNVDLQLVIGDHFLAFLGVAIFALGAAQHGFHPGHHLFGVKGLDYIVVGAQLQSQHLVKGLALGGEHDDGGGRGLADLSAHLPAVHLGQHNVQQYQIRCLLLEGGYGGLAVVGGKHRVALIL